MKIINIIFVSLSILLLGLSGISHAGNGRINHQLPPPVSDDDFYDGGVPNDKKVELGKLLFYDKILSGNRNISCATCHHALTDTGDGLSLPVGQGGKGLGVCREPGDIIERVPRNAPPVFNLGAKHFTRMFHDGRVEVDPYPDDDVIYPSGIKSPAGDDLPDNLDNVLAAQAMFPVTSPAEMCGYWGENDISENDISEFCYYGDVTAIWATLAVRLQEAVPPQEDEKDYGDLFVEAFDDIDDAKDITFAHAANAIAAFEAVAWRADNSPFDRYLRGDKKAMSKTAQNGMKLFYGKADCASCHTGAFQTDMDFHAVAMPQIGPGRGDAVNEDYGREQVTGDDNDRYKFRTPTLRNVALTGPWGHAGAYNSLEAVVKHFLNPVLALENYDTRQAVLTPAGDLNDEDFVVMKDPGMWEEIAAANERMPVNLRDWQVADLVEFLRALTDPASIDLRKDIPWEVPSGESLVD